MMRKLLCSALTLAIAAALSGCAPQDYTRSSAVADEFKKSLSGASFSNLDTVALCRINGKNAVSVLFDGGGFYHYAEAGDKLEFERHSTEGQRDNLLKAYAPVSMGCIGYYSSYLATFHPLGDYRLLFDMGRVQALAHNSIIFNFPFDERVKKQIAGAAFAVKDAIARQKTYVPVEKSWNP